LFVRLEVFFTCRMFSLKIFHRCMFIWLVVLNYTIFFIKDYIFYESTCMIYSLASTVFSCNYLSSMFKIQLYSYQRYTAQAGQK
jgi:hypothetical protein